MIELIYAAAVATFSVMKDVLVSVYIGLFLANVCSLGRTTDSGKRFVPFIVKVTGLPAACAVSVILALGDRTAGMAALAMAKKQSQLTDQEMIAANLVAKAPSVIQFFVFSFIPIMLTMYPGAVAVHFLWVYFLAFLSISIIGSLYARVVTRAHLLAPVTARLEPSRQTDWGKVFKLAFHKTGPVFVNMALWMAGMSFLAMLIIKTGSLNSLAQYVPLAAGGMNASLIPLAGTGLVSMLGGVAAVGAAFRDGLIPADKLVPLLLSLSVLHNFYDLFASSLPRTTAIFGTRLGLKIGLTGFVVTQAVMVAVIVLAC